MAKVLGKEEQLALVQQAQAGDERARERLIKTNIGLVHKLIRQYRPHFRTGNDYRQEDYDEYVQEGMIGLNNAIDKFSFEESEKHGGVSFPSFASWDIRAGLERADRVLNPFNITSASLRKGGKDHLRHTKSLDEKVSDERDAATLLDLLPCLDVALDEDVLLIEKIERAIAQLDDRLQYVFRNYVLGYTYDQIAEQLGVVRERVRQLTIQAINQLRKKLARQGVKVEDRTIADRRRGGEPSKHAKAPIQSFRDFLEAREVAQPPIDHIADTHKKVAELREKIKAKAKKKPRRLKSLEALQSHYRIPQERLDQALSALPEEQQFILRGIALGLSCKKIGLSLDYDHVKVGYWRDKAIQKLTRNLGLVTIPAPWKSPLRFLGKIYPKPGMSDDIDKLLSGERNLSGCDLSNLSFRGIDLSGRDFSGANLRGVFCHYCDFNHSDLRGANLYGASITFSDLSYCDLRGANLIHANLIQTQLLRADLSGVNIETTRASSTQLKRAVIREDIPIPKFKDNPPNNPIHNAVRVCKIATGELVDDNKPPVESTIMYELMQLERNGG